MSTTDGLASPPTTQFADWRVAGMSRGYEYHERIVAPKLPGFLFTEGDDVVAEHVLDAMGSTNPFLAGSLTGKYGIERAEVTTMFIAIPLARSMPNVVLVNARMGALRGAGITLGTRELLQLQGDFDRAFSLYCPIGGSGLALEMFTPELMKLLLHGAKNSDVEIVDDWMFIYGEVDRYGSEEMLDAIEAGVRRVGGAIVPRSFEGVASGTEGTQEKTGRTSGWTAAIASVLALIVGGVATWVGWPAQ